MSSQQYRCSKCKKIFRREQALSFHNKLCSSSDSNYLESSLTNFEQFVLKKTAFGNTLLLYSKEVDCESVDIFIEKSQHQKSKIQSEKSISCA